MLPPSPADPVPKRSPLDTSLPTPRRLLLPLLPILFPILTLLRALPRVPSTSPRLWCPPGPPRHRHWLLRDPSPSIEASLPPLARIPGLPPPSPPPPPSPFHPSPGSPTSRTGGPTQPPLSRPGPVTSRTRGGGDDGVKKEREMGDGGRDRWAARTWEMAATTATSDDEHQVGGAGFIRDRETKRLGEGGRGAVGEKKKRRRGWL